MCTWCFCIYAGKEIRERGYTQPRRRAATAAHESLSVGVWMCFIED